VLVLMYHIDACKCLQN